MIPKKPTSIRILNASSISDAFQKAVEFISDWAKEDPYCWFRGVNNGKHALMPGACWRKKYKELAPLIDFVQDGGAFTQISDIDQWETYYLAQHHRIPTRLLDWTDSFSASLFFAFDGWDGKTTPCIWILQPALLNEIFLNWKGILCPENIRETKAWLPKQIKKSETNPIVLQDEDGYIYDNSWPLAIYAKKSNKRITAQRGTFTVHGRNSESLEDLILKKGGNPSSLIAKIELTRFKISDVHNHLKLLGIRRSSIFPDLDNFVQELKETHDW
jgi:hypothetical protein